MYYVVYWTELTCYFAHYSPAFLQSVHHRPDGDSADEGEEDVADEPEEGEVEDGEIVVDPKSKDKKNYPCKLCPKIFSTPGNRSRHTSVQHKGLC